MGQQPGRRRHHTWDKGRKPRCDEEGCDKRAKDTYEERHLCRIHSPMRLNYQNKQKKK